MRAAAGATDSGPTAVRASGLVRTFGKVRALDGLDLTVQTGEILGLLGPNGSGKSTLIRVIAGLLHPTAGTVIVLQRGLPDRSVAARIGYMTQSAALYEDLTAQEDLIFFGRLYGLTRAEARRRDEPTVGIDPRNRRSLWEYFHELNRGGSTLLVSTHIMDEVERYHRVAMIEQGRIIALGTPDDLRRGLGDGHDGRGVSGVQRPGAMSLARIGAIAGRIFTQLRRDRRTLALILHKTVTRGRTIGGR